ncbi:hypothetical protein TNCV_335461 [Trichonephila clavipes]|nr:hypothetical protein TNCV_335461 [Trichonephila clavipes]
MASQCEPFAWYLCATESAFWQRLLNSVHSKDEWLLECNSGMIVIPFSFLRIVVKVTLFRNIPTTLLAIYEAYSLGFIFIESITKQDSGDDTADGRPDLGLDGKILVDL